ncbi:cupin domain-containing protein [Allosphingosinicella sp.]|uniref:cupin domain-containing protein n=1 Tax=Allosphingosinicella sp. TaxID=2823234 RepID=UPI002FC25F9E
MPKLDLDTIEPTNRTGYPEPFASDVAGRWYRRIGDAAEFKDFGASHVVLTPGATSAQRHWHEDEDELVIMLAGEAVLVEDDGRETMQPGDIAIFPMGAANGHHLVNESEADCAFVAIGRQGTGVVHYPDIDLVWNGPARRYEHKDGSPY